MALRKCSNHTGVSFGSIVDDSGTVGRRVPELEQPTSTWSRHAEAIPTIGWFSVIEPVEPWNFASPNEKIPPSAATNQ